MITLRDKITNQEFPVLRATPELRDERYNFTQDCPPGIKQHYLESPLLLPPAPLLPTPALNRIIWPVTGVSHFAFGHVLVSGEVAAQAPIWADVVLDDGIRPATNLPMYIIQRQPLVDNRPALAVDPVSSSSQGETAWVLTLVCQRYFDVAPNTTMSITTEVSWGTLIRGFLPNVGGGSRPTVAEIDALIPTASWGTQANAYWKTRAYLEHNNVIADSLLSQVGLRAVTDNTATNWKVQNPATAETAMSNWLNTNNVTLSGGLGNMDWSTFSVRLNGVSGTTVAMGSSPRARIPGSGNEATSWMCTTTTAFATAWFNRFTDWQARSHFQGDVAGFPPPPESSLVSHVVYEIDEGVTRVRRHPDRWPIPIRERAQLAVR